MSDPDTNVQQMRELIAKIRELLAPPEMETFRGMVAPWVDIVEGELHFHVAIGKLLKLEGSYGNAAILARVEQLLAAAGGAQVLH